MHLTARQLRQLKSLSARRDMKMTVMAYLHIGWRIHAISLLIAALALAAYFFLDWRPAAVMVGFVAGVVLRDVGWYRRLVAISPLSREITDWERVDALLAEHRERMQPPA